MIAPQRRRGIWNVVDCWFGVIVIACLAWGVGCKRESPPATQGTPAGPVSASTSGSSPQAQGGSNAASEAQGPRPSFVPNDPQLIEMNNRGVGLMGKFEYEAARSTFEPLTTQHPDWHDVQVNLAIATLNRQREGDEDAALGILEEVLKQNPDHLRAHYCDGLLRLYLQSPENALPHFQFVATADPDDAYAAYYLGQCLAQTRRPQDAVQWFEKAQQKDAYLRSAYYAAAQAYRALGKDDDAKRNLESFQQLEKNPKARLAEFKYTRMGPKANALAVDVKSPQAQPRPAGSIFADAAPLIADADHYKWIVRNPDRPVSITACDINGDGLIDVFIANVLDEDNGVRNAVCINKGGGEFALDVDHVFAMIPDVNAALWGDFDNDGLTDVYFCRRGPNMLWKQVDRNRWQDVTATAGAADGDYNTVDGAMFDADHDGDLDIFCVNADGPNELLNNNLDGTFRPIAQERGIAGSGKGSRQVVVADLDADRDVDIIVINNQPPHDVFINDRLWNYHKADDKAFGELRSLPILACCVGDVNADGVVEIFATVTGKMLRFDRDKDGVWRTPAETMPAAKNAPVAIFRQIAFLDVDGGGPQPFLHAPAAVQLASGRVSEGDNSGWTPVMLDPATGPAIVGLRNDGAPLIWRAGAGRYPFAAIDFKGKKQGDTIRSNASGIGTHYAARIDSAWTLGSTLRMTSGPGQSLQPQMIGLRGYPQMDFVSIDWSDGVFQSEIDLNPGEVQRITETQRQLSSCPVIFAWNGRKYEFVTDALGVGGIGYMAAPNEYAPARPWEKLMIGGEAMRSKDGAFVVKIAEPMEEACYLDAASLTAYDLPPGWRMTLDERMNVNGPEPTGAPVFYRREVRAIKATNGRGEDVTAALSAADRRAAPVGEIDDRFIGLLEHDHVLTLEFAEPINAKAGEEPALVIDGWIEYPYSQTMFAAWQAGAAYRAPSIDALGEDGQWHEALAQFGYPAGMPRQMSVPLKDLPAGVTALRIATNQEIYFDRIAVAYAEAPPVEMKRYELPLHGAKLIQSGFARRATGEQRQPYYDYNARVPYWDTRYQAGYYTRLGPVKELVKDVDDALAIFGPGEEIHMEFADRLPPIPYTLAAQSEDGDQAAGRWERVFVLELHGWCKDMDLYTKDGETIEPLPMRDSASAADTAARDALHAQFNTRFESGR